jgi:hypothetical protein
MNANLSFRVDSYGRKSHQAKPWRKRSGRVYFAEAPPGGADQQLSFSEVEVAFLARLFPQVARFIAVPAAQFMFGRYRPGTTNLAFEFMKREFCETLIGSRFVSAYW